MAKMIFVEEDHNLNGVKNIADAVAAQDAVAFHQLTEAIAGAGSPLTAGNGIDITNDVVSVVGEDGSISVLTTGVSVNVGRGIIKTPGVGDITVNTGDGLFIIDDKVSVRSEDGSISVMPTGVAVNVGNAIVKAPITGDIGVNVDGVSVQIVNDQVTVDQAWLAGQIGAGVKVNATGGIMDNAGAGADELAVRKQQAGALRSDANGMYVLNKPGGHTASDNAGLYVDVASLVNDPAFIAGTTSPLTAGDGIDITADVVSVKTAALSGLSLGPEGLSVDTADGIGKSVDNGSLYVNLGDGLHFAGANADFVTVKPASMGGISVGPGGIAVDVADGIGHNTDNGSLYVNLGDGLHFAGANADFVTVKTAPNSSLSLGPDGLSVDTADGIGKSVDNGSLYVNVGDGLHFAGANADFVTVNPKGGGHVGVDPAGVFVDVASLIGDPDFIAGAAGAVTVAGTAPITVVDDSMGGFTVGLAVDPAGGLTKTSGTGGDLAILPVLGGGILTDATGAFVDWTNVPAPSGDSDAATKAYVDQVASGMVPLAAVRAATVGAAIALDGSVTTLDGVALAPTDRVLAKDQVDPIQNGIYEVPASGAWVRSADADSEGELRVGSTVFVSEGATNANASFAVSSVEVGGAVLQDSMWTPEVDPSFWVKSSQISGYVEGGGIDINGNVISVDTGNGLAVVAGEVRVVTADGSISVGPTGVEAEVAPFGGLMKTAQGPRVHLDADSGLVVDSGGVLRVTGTGDPIVPGAPVPEVARIVRGTLTLVDLPNQTYTFVHGLGVSDPIVSIQDESGCDVTVDVCRPNINEVQIGLGSAIGTPTWKIAVTG